MLFLSDLLRESGHDVIPFSTKSEKNLSTPYEKYFVDYTDLRADEQGSIWQRCIKAKQFIVNRQAQKNIRQLFKDEKIDVAHVHNIYHHITPVILEELRRAHVPIIMTLHDLKLISPNYLMYHHGAIHEEDARGWYMSCVKNKCIADSRAKSVLAVAEMVYAHKIKKYYAKYVDTFISPSQFLMDKCVQYGWQKRRFRHLQHPTDLSSEIHKHKAGGFVMYFGRISEEKGIDVLIDAARLSPKLKFKIVGDGPLLEHFKLVTRRDGLQNIEFMGFQTGKELEKLQQQATIVCLPSVCYENYPLSILEAKARGKVVIASNSGGIPELLPGEYLFERGNSLDLAKKLKIWYGKKPQILDQVGKAMRADVEKNNDPQAYIKKLEKVYAKSG